MAQLSVNPLPTLFHESTLSSAAEGLWGTLDLGSGPFARETPAVREGEGAGEGGGSLPLCNRATAQPCNRRTPTRRGAAKKRGRIGPWGRHRCSLLQPIAPACKAGDVSTRYSLPCRPFANVGVAGSRPSFARLAQSARREAARAQRARSRAPENVNALGQLGRGRFRFGLHASALLN